MLLLHVVTVKMIDQARHCAWPRLEGERPASLSDEMALLGGAPRTSFSIAKIQQYGSAFANVRTWLGARALSMKVCRHLFDSDVSVCL
jgi:hypothetical protein